MASNTNNSFSTLHYGGSLRAAGSSSPGLSPKPAKRVGRPGQNSSFRAQKRFEMIARMENAALPEAAIAPMLGISVSRLRYLKKLPEYLVVRMRITHGIILDNDAQVAQIKEQRKELLIQLLPAALQTVADTLLSQPQSYADRKLKIEVAKDVLDRSDIYAKVSRTEIKPVSFFDFEKTDKDSADILRTLKSVGPAPAGPILEDTITTNLEFSSQSAGLSSEEQQAALDSLEDSIGGEEYNAPE